MGVASARAVGAAAPTAAATAGAAAGTAAPMAVVAGGVQWRPRTRRRVRRTSHAAAAAAVDTAAAAGGAAAAAGAAALLVKTAAARAVAARVVGGGGLSSRRRCDVWGVGGGLNSAGADMGRVSWPCCCCCCSSSPSPSPSSCSSPFPSPSSRSSSNISSGATSAATHGHRSARAPLRNARQGRQPLSPTLWPGRGEDGSIAAVTVALSISSHESETTAAPAVAIGSPAAARMEAVGARSSSGSATSSGGSGSGNSANSNNGSRNISRRGGGGGGAGSGGSRRRWKNSQLHGGSGRSDRDSGGAAANGSRGARGTFLPRSGQQHATDTLAQAAPAGLRPASSQSSACVTAVASAGGQEHGNGTEVVVGRAVEESRQGRGDEEDHGESAAGVGDAASAAAGAHGVTQFEHNVEVWLRISPQRAWRLWTDLARAPEWMRWIERVEYISSSDSSSSDPDALRPTSSFLLTAVSSTAASSDAQGEDGSGDGDGDGELSLQRLFPSPLSRWTCSTAGFEVSWVAEVTRATRGGGSYALSTQAQAGAAAGRQAGGGVGEPCFSLEWVTVEGIRSSGRVLFCPAAELLFDAGTNSSSSSSSSNVLMPAQASPLPAAVVGSNAAADQLANAPACRIHLQISHSLPASLGRIMNRHALDSLIQATLRSDLERFEQLALAEDKA